MSFTTSHIVNDSETTRKSSIQKPRMKVAMLAVSLLLVLACGEALKCNRCIGKGCTTTVETCSSDQDACCNVIFLPPMPVNYFRRCIRMTDCVLFKQTPNINAVCCNRDRCN
ncbi:cytotoxin I-like T-15 [Scleropages formosus]|nr:cytotoxin I-like T-15 [Scleropages formosus]